MSAVPSNVSVSVTESIRGVVADNGQSVTPECSVVCGKCPNEHKSDAHVASATDTFLGRSRSSLSESQVAEEQDVLRCQQNTDNPKRKKIASDICRTTASRKCRSLYGVFPETNFGPKACLLQSQDSTLTIQDPGSQMLTWDKPPQSVLIIKKIRDDAVDGPFVELAEWLSEAKKLVVYVEQKVLMDPMITEQPAFKKIQASLSTFREGFDELAGKVDLIICLGGDGTLLYVSTLFQESVPPVMSFHLGSLGFLSPFEFPDYADKISKVLQGDEVRLILRTRLECQIVPASSKNASITNGSVAGENHHRKTILALNEVVVDRGSTPYLCQLDLYIQNKQVTVVQGDGLIISTPTGSTAYAAAAGSSMVHPNVPAIIVAPICPHSLSFRPIVVPAGVEIKVMVSPEARDVAWASFDGRNRCELKKGDVLTIRTSKYSLPSICRNDPISDWFESLAGCLHWNVRKTQSALASEALDTTVTRV